MIGLLKSGPRMKRLVVEYADIWSCWLASTNSHAWTFQAPLEAMVTVGGQYGCDPATLHKAVTTRVCSTEIRPSIDNNPICGSLDNMVGEIRKYESMGVSHLPVWLWSNNKKV